MDSPRSERMVDVGEVRLHVVSQGAGAPVVLLHGFPEFWYSWRHQMSALAAAGFQALAPDMRGYNLSDKPRGVAAYATARLTADVAGLIRALGHERAHVVGHDWGGAVAWHFASSYPSMVERLAILNCPHPAIMARRIWRPRQLRRSWYMFFFQVPRLPESRVTRPEFVERAFRGWSARPGAFTDEDLRLYHEALCQPGAATAAINYYRAAFRALPWRVPRVACPTLLVWGDQDRALGQELIPGTEAIAPDLTVRHIPDASHWVQQDRPETVNALLVPFLRGERV